MNVRFLLLVLFAALFRAPAAAQTNERTVIRRNVTLTFGMKKARDLDGAYVASPYGEKVSGTNVELQFYATVTCPTSPPLGPTDWNYAEIQLFQVTSSAAAPSLTWTGAFYPADTPPAGAEVAGIPSDEAPEPAPQGTGTAVALLVEGAKLVRIASTEVADGATIPFKLEIRLKTAHHENGVETEAEIWPIQIVEPSLTACNRLLLLATNEEYATVYNDPMHTQPLYQDYLTTLGPYSQPLYRNVAAAAMPLVRPFWDTVHHTIFPDAGKEAKWGENAANTDTTWRTQNLDAEMSKYTAFFAFTHGEYNPSTGVHFRASVGPNTVSDGQVFGSEVRTYGYTGRTIPDYQVAIFYACSLGGSTSLPNGFKIDQINQLWKGIAGFPQQCYYKLYSPSNTTLDQHAKKLMEYLAQGMPLTPALQRLQGNGVGQDNMVPATVGQGSMPMGANGSYMRLRYVYLEPNVYNMLKANPSAINTWYYLL